MSRNTTILILVNSSIFSSGIKSILEKADFLVAGEAKSWKELFELLFNKSPQILLLDLVPFNDNCLEWLEKLRSQYPDIPIALIIKKNFANYFRELILLGITGFIYSNTTPQDLVKAIELVSNGQEYFPTGMLNMFRETLQLNEVNIKVHSYQDLLTTREVTVCKLLCNGLTYKEIGVELFISPRTVETHKKNILSKLKVKSTADLVKYAIKHRLI